MIIETTVTDTEIKTKTELSIGELLKILQVFSTGKQEPSSASESTGSE